MSKMNVAIIGVGGIARTHIAGWKDTEYAELVGGADLDETSLNKFAKDHDVTKISADYKDLLDDPSIDIIDVCTPSNYHTQIVLDALAAGKHVICEKPLAPTPDEIRTMIEARDKSGKQLMTAQHFRFQGTSMAMKAEIDTGCMGEIYHARSWMLRRNAAAVRESFILKKNSGGGPCIDIGVHILDLTLWFMGNPEPISVTGVARNEIAKQEGSFSCWGGAIPRNFDVEDFASAFVRFDNGATLILEVSWLLHHYSEKVEDMQMWLYGTQSGSHWPSCELYSSNYDTQQHYNRELKITDNIREPHAQECVAFAEAMSKGEASPVPPEDSLKVQRILDGIYRSQDEGKEVSV